MSNPLLTVDMMRKMTYRPPPTSLPFIIISVYLGILTWRIFEDFNMFEYAWSSSYYYYQTGLFFKPKRQQLVPQNHCHGTLKLFWLNVMAIFSVISHFFIKYYKKNPKKHPS